MIREPLDPATPEGAAAEQALNQVLAGVLVRLDREEREAALLTSTTDHRSTA